MHNQEMFLYGDSPDTDVVGSNPNTYILEKLEYVVGTGTLLYVQGALYPRKGYPRVEEARAINVLKAILLEAIKQPWWFIFGPKKFVDSCNKIAGKVLRPRLLKPLFLCPTARTVDAMLYIFLFKVGIPIQTAKDFAYNVAHIIEYDDAYKYILQDLATEASAVDIVDKPIRELYRLSKILKERATVDVAPKVNKIIIGVILLLFIPRFRKAMLLASNIGVKNMQYDAADWYWVCDRDDYLFGGKTYKERRAEFDTWPPVYRLNGEDVTPL